MTINANEIEDLSPQTVVRCGLRRMVFHFTYKEMNTMFSTDNPHLSTEQVVSFSERQIDTVIDGCHVTMRFPESTDNSALENVRNILKSAYLNSLSG